MARQRTAYLAKLVEGSPLKPKGSPRKTAHSDKVKRLTAGSFLMFISACQRGGNLAAAVQAAEEHNLLGFTITKEGLACLMQSCADADKQIELVARVYALWQKLGFKVDAEVAIPAVRAACSSSDFDTAHRWLRSFKDAGVQGRRPLLSSGTIEANPEVHRGILRPAVEGGRVDVVLELGRRPVGQPSDLSVNWGLGDARPWYPTFPGRDVTGLVALTQAQLFVGDIAAATDTMRLALKELKRELSVGEEAHEVGKTTVSWPAKLYSDAGGGQEIVVQAGELQERMAQCVLALTSEGLNSQDGFDALTVAVANWGAAGEGPVEGGLTGLEGEGEEGRAAGGEGEGTVAEGEERGETGATAAAEGAAEEGASQSLDPKP
jgi:hypothetical protein